MLNTNLKPLRGDLLPVKAMRCLALAFFWFSFGMQPAGAQTNYADGIAYGTNYANLATAVSIASLKDGEGSLAIGHPGTTGLVISNTIAGTVEVSNHFNGFSIDATGGLVTGSKFATLTVLEGTNLTITGGAFIGTQRTDTGSGPPIPGQASQTSSESSAAMGGVFFNTTNVFISGTTFKGTTFASDASTSEGTDGLLLLSVDEVTLENVTVKGGDGGNIAGGTSTGGRALYIENSLVTLSNGTYSGGSSGQAATSIGGEALHATNSTLTIAGGASFTGGNNAAALYAKNSDLTINGGTFQGGTYETNRYFGLLSIVSAGQSNNIALNGGTFNSIDFAGSGIQFVTAGSNLTVDGYVVLDGSQLTVLNNQSDSAFQNLLLRSGQLQFSGGYSLASGGNLEFLLSTNTYATLTANSASFETNSTIRVDASQASFKFGTTNIALVTTASGIYIVDAAGNTNSATRANLATNVNIIASVFGRTKLSEVSITNSALLFTFNTQTLKDYLNATGTYGSFIDELEAIMPDQMNTAINQINDPDLTSRAIGQTYFTTFNNFQASLQGLRTAVGQSLSRGSEFREQLRLLPPGVRGPERNNQLRGWAKYYGNFSTHEGSGINPGYDSILHGGVVGVDTSIGNLLIGASGGSSHYRLSAAGNAQSETVAYHGNLFGTYGMDRGYIDGGIAYGANQVDTRTANPFRIDGNFDSQIALGYLGGGYDLIDLDGGTVFTPEASVQYATYQQDAYTERSTAAVPRAIDGLDADSLLSTIGMNVSMLNIGRIDTFDYKVDLRIHWMHEFNPDPSSMKFTIQNSGGIYQFAYPALDEDLYRIGIGCSFFNSMRNQPKNIMLRFDFDELFGDGFNSHNVSAKLVYAF